ncbi:MAG: 2-dehydropantoate 2-reductase [Desulfobacterota bacterium]|nr:2-dehydropantoate 2-reductase [Thermodesulfobacteriota bacterium]
MADADIVVVGPGAMGCLFAGLFRKAGFMVWLLARTKTQADRVRETGICIEEGDTIWRMPWPHITNDVTLIGRAHCILLCVKAYDTDSALKSVVPLIGSDTIVVTLQNGLGHIDIIKRYMPEERIIAGITAHGATRLGNGYIRHAGVGETIIGAVTATGKDGLLKAAQIFYKAGIPTTTTDNITSVLWGKLIVNAAINPLTAIFRLRNGDITSSQYLQDILRAIVGEAQNVAHAWGITLPYTDPLAKVFDVCRATAENFSSMLQDVNAHRETEIDFINAAIVRYGEAMGVPTPVNRVIVLLVKALCQVNTCSVSNTNQ